MTYREWDHHTFPPSAINSFSSFSFSSFSFSSFSFSSFSFSSFSSSSFSSSSYPPPAPSPPQTHSKLDAIIFDACFPPWKGETKERKNCYWSFILNCDAGDALSCYDRSLRPTGSRISFIYYAVFTEKCTTPFCCTMIETRRKIDGVFPPFSDSSSCARSVISKLGNCDHWSIICATLSVR